MFKTAAAIYGPLLGIVLAVLGCAVRLIAAGLVAVGVRLSDAADWLDRCVSRLVA